ncbi:MAG: NADP-dependent oxidoreductase [Caulobacteraceae bacterium]|jgi:NADPH:quinone reductase-like Zn-dependent oxidoreductase
MTDGAMRTLRFHGYGEPAVVLRLEAAEVPIPQAGHVRVRVEACGLNPADWALCRGFMAGDLPRGVGLDVAGVVEALGEGVSDVTVGDRVLGVPDFRGYPTAGAADRAALMIWTKIPQGLGFVAASALPMAVETASRCLDRLEPVTGRTLLIYGAGAMMGFAAVQMAIMRGARVIAAAGDTFARELEGFGATVTPYGEGMVERVREICGGAPDLILDVAPVDDALPALIEVAGGDPQRIVSVRGHLPGGAALGVRHSFAALRYDALPEFAALAAEGRFRIPIARTFPLQDWREAMDLSLSGHAHGKLVLLPQRADRD